MTLAAFAAAIVGVPCAVGLPVAFHHTLVHYSLTARILLAWVAGSLAVAVILTLSSALGIRWSPWIVVPIAVLTSAAAVRKMRRVTVKAPGRQSSHGAENHIALATILLIAAAGLFSFAAGTATSADLSYFWGVKAVHFALERGIDFDLLRQPFMIHLHPNYPPLWPVLLGWSTMVAGAMPWLAIPSLTWICLSAAAAVIFCVLKTRLGASAAAIVTCLWYGVLSSMAVTSFSGGNADGPLVLFVSVALVVILTENTNGQRRLGWVAAIALAGAVFTKSEGGVLAALMVAGVAVRNFIWKRPRIGREVTSLIAPAVIALVLWVVVRIAHGLPLADPIRETVFEINFDHVALIVRVCARLLTTGVVAVGWLVPLISLFMVRGPRLSRALPGIVTACGIPLFAFVYYLHAIGNPLELIVWTFPRLMQPAISAWILGCGVAVFPVEDSGESAADLTRETSR